jgi:carboxyl-terminal processing protease
MRERTPGIRANDDGRVRRLIVSATASLALLLAACGVDAGEPVETPPPTIAPEDTATPAGPTATPTPDLQLLLRDGGITMIQDAYSRLLDEYITPLDHAPLLAAAWASLQQEASVQGAAAPPRPDFSGDRVAAFEAFRAAYVPLANGIADATKLRHATIRGMAASLQDCHTFFLSPVASDTLVDQRSGKGAVGIGVELAGVPPLITEVVTGGPAAGAGVLVGDRISSVDGRDTTQSGPASAFDLINGTEGTTVRLVLERPGTGAVDVTIERARVTPPNVEWRMIGERIAYIRVRNFVDTGVAPALREILPAIEEQDADAWIIDMRGNPGGRLDPDAMALFTPDGAVVARDRGRDGTTKDSFATGTQVPNLPPIAVLINNRTGSVAEVWAAALDEYDAAYLIGATTNGCVGYTDIRELGDGSSLAVTTHVNISPVSGEVLNGVGVEPDMFVARTEDDIANGRDPQLDAAVAHLEGVLP